MRPAYLLQAREQKAKGSFVLVPGPFEPMMPGIAEWFAEHPPQDTVG